MTPEEIRNACEAHDKGERLWPVLYEWCSVLLVEIDRLSEGNFTEEEFQNLCHNFTDCGRERFEKGCQEYQNKLFGPKE